MQHSKLLKRYAAWGLALGVLVACGTNDSTPPSTYGYPTGDDGSTLGLNNSSGSGGASSGSSGDSSNSSSGAGSSGGQSSGGSSGSGSGNSSGAGNSSGSGSGGRSCPSSCRANTDCGACGLSAGGTGTNCCVMGMCVMMTTCPTIRDSGRDGS